MPDKDGENGCFCGLFLITLYNILRGFKTVVFCLELFYKILDFPFVVLYLCIVGMTENNYYLNLNFFKL